MYMHGREGTEGENRRLSIIIRSSGCSQHMRSVPVTTTTRTTVEDAGDSPLVSAAAITATFNSASASFSKDGRKISVGDCALFKPPQDCPPFIGIIRWLTLDKENNLQLGVNWLYRPAEVKLGKGILLDAAPNELFYSFHKDEIPAASLLHPCKVAFLPKGVDLPTGISSFVCRRVYDIANKCLWWLTDQDYIDERQEEVDKLLRRTHIKMDAIVQPGGRSPKPTSILMSTSQLKPGSDNLQNSATSVPSQTKGKKRERGDHCTDPVKRERLVKTDDSDFGPVTTENPLLSEVTKITEKGGLVDSDAVEKIVQLMQLDRIDKKMDLSSRSVLAGVIASTDRFDCLRLFIQLKGLHVLDEWLQDVHKGKVGDGNSSKDGDKSSEEFLFVLLRAFDRLPVNLHALQTSNIGRSVNHLRSHKNLEIQKKARSLVDTWKKRVEAEMNVIDAKSGSTQAASWSSKARVPEGLGRNCGGSGDVAFKSSVTQLSLSKTASIKASQGETTTKSSSLSPGPVKSASSPASGKEVQPRNKINNVSDVPLSAREEKSSSSSQSRNNSQSFSGKEDPRRSTAGSLSVNKISSGGSRHRKSINGFPGTPLAGSPKETSSSRNSPMHRNAVQEKFPHSALTGEKAFDLPVLEGSSHKLIVKIPNHGRSPARGISGGSLEDPHIMSSRASSPVPADKHEQSDHNPKENCDSYQTTVTPEVNAESWQSNDSKDSKDLQTGSDEGDGSPATLPGEERSRTVEDTRKAPEVFKVGSSSSGNDLKSVKLHEASFSSMNALIESCVKYSVASTSTPLVDDVGMNLLASVAAGEICKSELVSPSESPQGSAPPLEQTCVPDDAKSKPFVSENAVRDQHQSNDVADDEKLAIPAVGSFSKDGILLSKQPSSVSSRDRKPASGLSEETVEPTSDRSSDMNEKSDAIVPSRSFSPTAEVAKETDEDLAEQAHEENKVRNTARTDVVSDAKLEERHPLITEVKQSNALSSTEDLKPKVEVSSSIPSAESDCKKDVSERLKTLVHMEQKPAVMADEKLPEPTVSGKDLVSENVDDVKVKEADENCGINCFNLSEGQTLETETSLVAGSNDQSLASLTVAANHQKIGYLKANVQNMVLELQNMVLEPRTSSFAENTSPAFPSQDADGKVELKGPKLSNAEPDKTEECTSTIADTPVSAAGPADMNSKVNFDLNEGLIGDEGKDGEPVNLPTSGSLSNVHVLNPLSTVSSSSCSIPASITVVAAAKGPFVPPVDLLRSKGELGWKGSAATSAFRRAEPRKFLQLPVGPITVSPDDSTGKASRPLLDIDLNIADERLLEDMACRDSTAEIGSMSNHSTNHEKARSEAAGCVSVCSSGGLDLDLNRIDDANDMINCPSGSSDRLEGPPVPVKSLSSSLLSTSEIRRDFDLNNGPGVDDTGVEQSSFNQQGRGSTFSLHSQIPVSGVRPKSHEAGSFSAWFPPGSSYSSGNIPSIVTDRGDQPVSIIPPGLPQRIVGPPGCNPFTPDVYRGSVLSSSPAMSFPSSAFSYQMFPFGTSLPLPSATFPVGSTSYADSASGGRIFNPAMNSQFLGPVGSVSSPYARPYMLNLPDGVGNGVVENNRKWNRQILDLNAGPGAPDTEGRDEIFPQRQRLVANSQALVEEQARVYPIAGGVLKRKEPEGGRDSESFRYK